MSFSYLVYVDNKTMKWAFNQRLMSTVADHFQIPWMVQQHNEHTTDKLLVACVKNTTRWGVWAFKEIILEYLIMRKIKKKKNKKRSPFNSVA